MERDATTGVVLACGTIQHRWYRRFLDDSTDCRLLREWMKGALKFAVIGEVLTGLALLIVPVLVGQLLLGVEFSGAAIPAARVAGIALIGLSVACLPGLAQVGMLTYGVLVMLYLGYLGLVGGFAGILLWPAVVVHAMLSVLLARAWFKSQVNGST